jgi:uncharacterized membrane protein
MLEALVHTLHVVLAGAWFGGVVFTTFVVSPALAAMKWSEPERVVVRSGIGKQYAKVGSANLVLLLVFAVLDGVFGGFGGVLYVEYALILALFGLVALHGAYFGRRLAELARSEVLASDEASARLFADRRRELQKLSLRVSWVTLVVSLAVLALAVNG